MFTFLLRVLEGLAAQPGPERRLSDVFPDIPLTDQFGRSYRFQRDFVDPGGTLVMNTMYTNCRGSCSGTSATIESLRQELSPVFGKRVRFLSFTLEPQVDTATELFKFGKLYGAGERESTLSEWLFLRAAPDDWEQLRRSLGFFELDPRVDSDITQHASLLLVGNLQRNRWAKLPAELREPVLLDAIRRIAGDTLEEQFGIVN